MAKNGNHSLGHKVNNPGVIWKSFMCNLYLLWFKSYDQSESF